MTPVLSNRVERFFRGAVYLGIFSKWRKIEVVKWAEDAIYAPIQTTDDKNRSLR